MKHLHLLFIVFGLSILFVGLNAQPHWRKLGPLEGGSSVLNFSEGQPGAVYSCTRYNVYRTTNNGDSWELHTAGLPNARLYWVHAAKSRLVYIATDAGLFRCTDSTVSQWTRVDKGFEVPSVQFIESDPFTGVLFAGISMKLYASNDNGNTWSEFAKQIDPAFRRFDRCGRIYFNVDHEIIVGFGRNLFRSTNSGQSWAIVLPNLGTSAISSDYYENMSRLSLLPGATELMFSRNRVDYYDSNYSFDYDATVLEYILNRHGELAYSAIAFIDSTTGRFLYSIWTNGVVNTCSTSCNPPAVYTNVGLRCKLASRMIRVSNNTVFLSTLGGGVYRSSDFGAHWEEASTGMSESKVWDIVKMKGTQTMFCATSGGVYKSVDNGETWENTSSGMSEVLCMSVALTQKQTLLAATLWGIYRSVDLGETWVKADSGLKNKAINKLFVAPGNRIYAATTGKGIQYSDDDGKTWVYPGNDFASPLGRDLVTDISYNSTTKRMYCSSRGGCVMSKDTAKTWIDYNPGISVPPAFRTDGGHLMYGIDVDEESNFSYMASVDGVWRLDEKSLYWNNFAIDYPDKYCKTIKVNQNGVVFTGTLNKGIYRSVDSAVTWTAFTSGMPNFPIYSLFVDEDSYIYAGTAGGGIYKTVNPTASLSQPLLRFPVQDSVCDSTFVRLMWQKVKYGQTYELLVKKRDGTVVLDDSLVSGTTRQVLNLESNTAYTWKVRAIHDGVKSAWSDEWSFTVAKQIPGQVALRAPRIDSVLTTLTPTFYWNEASDAEYYHLQIAENPEMTLLVVDDSTLTSTTKNVLGLTENRSYYWRIHSKNEKGSGKWSNVWSFSTSSNTSVASLPTNPAKWQLFPNPAGNELHCVLQAETAAGARISITDLLGNSILECAASVAQTETCDVVLDISNVANGCYAASLITPTQVLRQRFMILR